MLEAVGSVATGAPETTLPSPPALGPAPSIVSSRTAPGTLLPSGFDAEVDDAQDDVRGARDGDLADREAPGAAAGPEAPPGVTPC